MHRILVVLEPDKLEEQEKDARMLKHGRKVKMLWGREKAVTCSGSYTTAGCGTNAAKLLVSTPK